jgi:hypothetical protein
MLRVCFRKLNNAEVKEWYQVKILYKFSALEKLDDMWASVVFGRILERPSDYQPKIV